MSKKNHSVKRDLQEGHHVTVHSGKNVDLAQAQPGKWLPEVYGLG
jgi:hypothetical protein